MASANSRGGRLREGRLIAKKTLEEVAGEITVSVSTYKKWEYDQTSPRGLDQISAVCKAVGISIDYYIDGTDCSPSLPSHERELLSGYRRLSYTLQQCIQTIIDNLSGSKG